MLCSLRHASRRQRVRWVPHHLPVAVGHRAADHNIALHVRWRSSRRPRANDCLESLLVQRAQRVPPIAKLQRVDRPASLLAVFDEQLHLGFRVFCLPRAVSQLPVFESADGSTDAAAPVLRRAVRIGTWFPNERRRTVLL